MMKRRPAVWPIPLLLSIGVFVTPCGARGAGEQLQPNNRLAPLARGSLEVWVPDTFFTGGTEPPARVTRQYQWSPLITEFRNDFPDFDLRFNILDRTVFVQAIHLAGPKPPPDIVFVDNQSERDPLMDSPGVIEMLGLSRFHQNGWWLSFRQSKNFEAAEAFVLWLSQSPHGQQWQMATTPMQKSDSTAIQAISTEAVSDYLRADARSLSSLMDPQASRFYRLTASESLGPVEPLLTFGGSKLPFALMAAVCQREKAFGMLHSALVLRNVEGRWKVLLFLEGTLPSLEAMLRSFDRLKLQDGPPETAPVLKLLTPADHASLPRFPAGELQWEAVNSDVSSYLVESQFGQPERTNPGWSLSRIALARPGKGEPQIRVQIPFGVGMQPHRWRIWAILGTGDVSISNWRTIDFTN